MNRVRLAVTQFFLLGRIRILQGWILALGCARCPWIGNFVRDFVIRMSIHHRKRGFHHFVGKRGRIRWTVSLECFRTGVRSNRKRQFLMSALRHIPKMEIHHQFTIFPRTDLFSSETGRDEYDFLILKFEEVAHNISPSTDNKLLFSPVRSFQIARNVMILHEQKVSDLYPRLAKMN